MGKRKSIVTFDKKTMLEMEEKEQQEKRPFWRINPKLVPLQFLTFIFYGGMAALYPFLTIHMKSLGFTTTETAIIYGVLPLLCFIGPAITGWAGDKIGNYKLILAIAIGVNVILHMLVYFAVPVYSVTHVPERFATRSIALLLPCQDGSKVPLEMEDFLHFPDAERLGDCASTNSTHPNGTDHVLAFLQSQSCSSTCKMSNEASGSARVCMQTDGCVPVTDLFYRYGFSNSSAHANSPKAVTSNNTECVDSGQPSCFVNCSLSEALPVTCFREVVEGHRPTMFWMYFVFRVISSIALASVFPLLDAATIQMTIDHHGDIGRVKMYSLLAICVWPPLSGVMIDQLGMGFAPAFYVYGILHVASVVVVLLMSLNVKLPAENIWSHVGVLLKNPKVAVFVIVVFFIGSAWGVLDSFLFWFMEEDLHSETWLLGFTSTVGGICGLPVLAFATWIISKTGHNNILIFAMFVYGVRFIGYSFIYNPYYVLPLEALEAFTASLMWITATIYTSKIAPKYLATLQGIVGGMHYGIGRGAGSFIGGFMISQIGARQTWRTFGYVCFACGTIYATLQCFWLRKLRIVTEKKSVYRSAEELKHSGIDPAEDELKEMDEEEEEMLQEVAALGVFRAMSAAALSGSMVNLKKDDDAAVPDDPARLYEKSDAELSAVEDEEVFGYDERREEESNRRLPRYVNQPKARS